MKETNVYIMLTEKLGVKTPSRLTGILQEAYTAEECTLLLELFQPATCQELAARLGMDESKVKGILEVLVDKGALTKGKTQYAFHKTALALHHDVFADTGVLPLSDKLRELWADFFYNEFADEHFLAQFADEMEKTGQPFFRVWPAMGALEMSPGINPEDIMPEENWRLRIENAKRRIVAPCGCRVSWGVECEHPVDGACFSNFDSERGEYYLGKPGRQLKELSLEETLEQVRNLEKAGLVHIGSCYCCPDSCEIMFPLHRAKRWDLLGSSRYVPVVDEEACTGCQVCIDKCYFDAIDMKKQENSKKYKASIIKDKCLGCGLCIVACKEKAMVYVIDKPPEHITSGVNRNAGTDAIKWGYYNLD
jgi:Na+-translocating ferredoxin:NAD+ oxidoreductase RNF subunit RnfB